MLKYTVLAYFGSRTGAKDRGAPTVRRKGVGYEPEKGLEWVEVGRAAVGVSHWTDGLLNLAINTI